jgi:hypothetical protein
MMAVLAPPAGAAAALRAPALLPSGCSEAHKASSLPWAPQRWLAG